MFRFLANNPPPGANSTTSSTPGTENNVKPRFSIGSKVEVNYDNSGNYIPAVIQKDAGHGYYNVVYEGGNTANRVSERFIRLPVDATENVEEKSRPASPPRAQRRRSSTTIHEPILEEIVQEFQQEEIKIPTPPPEPVPLPIELDRPELVTEQVFEPIIVEEIVVKPKESKRKASQEEIKRLRRIRECNDETNQTVLDISKLKLSEMTKDLLELTKIKELYASKNEFGNIEWIISYKFLNKIDLSFNTTLNSTTVYQPLSTLLKFLRFLDISGNQLKEIPETIKTLIALQVLYVRRNSISCVPDWLTNLSALRTIDLSYNAIEDISQLSIFEKMRNLDILNIDHNPCRDQQIPVLAGGHLHYLLEKVYFSSHQSSV